MHLYILDPFCNICGKYKGIGFCKDPGCKGHTTHEMNESDSSTFTLSKQYDKHNQCLLCRNPSIVICDVCNQGFCEVHSKGMEESKLLHKDQHIGTCAKCQSYVCENCWILDASGSIICLDHMEKNQ